MHTDTAPKAPEQIELSGDIVEGFPAAKPVFGRSYLDAFATVPGHKERRRYRRSKQRDAINDVQRANRRRFRAYRSNLMAVTTLKQQVRIFDGEIGNEHQRARVTTQFTQQARELGQPLDEVLSALRTGLGMDDATVALRGLAG